MAIHRVVRQYIKRLNAEGYKTLRELCHVAKNLFNQATYNNRQGVIFNDGEFPSYEENYASLKSSYKILNSNMAQQTLKEVDGNFKSFAALSEAVKEGNYPSEMVRLPRYLPKDAFTTLVIGQIRLKRNKFALPYSRLYKKDHKPIEITIPPILDGKKIKEIRIVPWY